MNEHAQFIEYCKCFCLLTVACSMEMTDEIRRAVLDLGGYLDQLNRVNDQCDFVREHRPRLEKLLRDKLETRDLDEEPSLNRFYHKPSVKPCPFCGAPGEICVYPTISWGRCTRCGASTNASKDANEALRLWNMRAGERNQRRLNDERR